MQHSVTSWWAVSCHPTVTLRNCPLPLWLWEGGIMYLIGLEDRWCGGQCVLGTLRVLQLACLKCVTVSSVISSDCNPEKWLQRSGWENILKLFVLRIQVRSMFSVHGQKFVLDYSGSGPGILTLEVTFNCFISAKGLNMIFVIWYILC